MEYDLSDVKTVLAKYYVGIHIDNNGCTLWDYLTKLLILYSIMTNIHDNYMLDLLDKKETDKENIKAAYFRYIKGQFGVNIIHDDEELEEFDLDEQLELDKAWLQKYSRIKDDWLINYNNLEEYETGRGEIRKLVS